MNLLLRYHVSSLVLFGIVSNEAFRFDSRCILPCWGRKDPSAVDAKSSTHRNLYRLLSSSVTGMDDMSPLFKHYLQYMSKVRRLHPESPKHPNPSKPLRSRMVGFYLKKIIFFPL